MDESIEGSVSSHVPVCTGKEVFEGVFLSQKEVGNSYSPV